MKKSSLLLLITILAAIVDLLLNVISSGGHTLLKGHSGTHNIDQRDVSGNNTPLKKIALWNLYHGYPNWNYYMGDKKRKMVDCDVPCLASTERTNPLQYDAVILHGRNAQDPPKVRTSNQVYIMHLKEPPYLRGEHFFKGVKYYNWTMTYNKRSEVWTPYFYFDEKSPETTKGGLNIDLPQLHHTKRPMEALVLWVVSKCRRFSQRKKYIDMLKRHMKVDIYGKCGKKCPDTHVKRNCFELLAKTGRYKFYLSFENSACEQYFTEKIYNPMNFGLIPVVYGALNAQEYKDMLPPHSYIDVRNFESPKHLADYLQYLDGNDTAYLEYFNWRSKYTLRGEIDSFAKGMCGVCKLLHDDSMKIPRNVNFEKFWSTEGMCDSQILQKVLSKKH